MKRTLTSLIAIFLLIFVQACKKEPEYASLNLDKLIINEICPALSEGENGWIEIMNPGTEDIDVYGMKILVTDDYYYRNCAYQLPDISIKAGERYVIPEAGKSLSIGIKADNLEEVCLSSGADELVAVVDVKSLAASVGKPQAGGSWSLIPDGSADAEMIVSEKATPGEKNYKFVPYKINGIIINEISPAEGWVELYHSGIGALTLYETTLVLTDWSDVDHVIYSFEEGSTIKSREYLPVNANLGDLKALKLVSNEGIVVDSFQLSDVKDSGNPISSQSYSRLPDITGDWYISGTPTKGAANQDSTEDISELVLNEFSPASGWVEICNPTVRILRVDRAKLVVDDKSAGTLSGTINPGGRVVMNVTATNASTIKLLSPDGSTVVDSFSAANVADGMVPEDGGSWSRIPDGDSWYTVKTASKNEQNYGIIKGNSVGIWYNQSNTPSLSSNLDKFVKLGIGHVFLHEYAFKYYEDQLPAIFEKARKLGISIHIWMQCFWWNDNQGVNGWRSPVIDAEKRYDQDMFDDILGENRATKYVKAGVQGIHFDYIRFGGTAYKHDYPEVGVTGVGAIDEFCRQASEKLKAINPDLILSAALMSERGSERYYGQHPESMGQYIDILVPMIYLHSSGYSYGTCVGIANYFAQHGSPALCWAGTQTYTGSGSGLGADELKADCEAYIGSQASGVVLFRHGLGTLPNLLDLKLNE